MSAAIAPHAIEVEVHVIGALLLDDRNIHALSSLLAPEDFYLDLHTKIFRAALQLAIAGKPTDIISLMDALRGDVSPEKIRIIADSVASDANLLAHAEIIREKSIRRALQRQHLVAYEEIGKQEYELREQLARTDSAMAAITARQAGDLGFRIVPGQEWKAEALAAYEETASPYLSTGWPNMDERFRHSSGQLALVTGVPNHGKSEWLDALMVNAARLHGHRVAYFSPENHPLQRHVRKLAEKYTGKNLYGYARMSRPEYERALEWVQDHFHFSDQGLNGTHFDQILAAFSRISPRPQHAVLDPWNRIEAQRAKNTMETDFIRDCLVRGLRFCQSTGINLWMVVHPQKLRRLHEGNQLTQPGMYDMAGSAHWANLTDNAFMVWRDFEARKTDVHTLKARFKDQGSPGTCSFAYEWQSGRYIPFDARKAEEDAESKKIEEGKRMSGIPEADW